MQPSFDLEKMTFTPDIAAAILEAMPYEHQRPIKSWHVKELAEAMKSGWFTSNTIVLCENGDGRRYLTNGQHTLKAIIESGVTLTLPVQIVKAGSHSDVGRIYGTIDRGSRRNITDSLRSHGLMDSLGMTRTDMERYASAARLVMCDLVNTAQKINMIQDEDLVDFMLGWQVFAKSYLACADGSPLHNQFTRRDVFSVGLVTFRYNPDVAANFWRQVATDDGLPVGDPRKTLNRWLSVSGIQAGSVARKRRIVNTAEGIRSCALAWNAWRRGNSLTLIRVLSTTSELVLVDTPFVKGGRQPES